MLWSSSGCYSHGNHRIGSVLNLPAYTDENTSSKGSRSPLSHVTCGRTRRTRRRTILNRSVLTWTLLLMIFYRIFVAKHSNELFSQPIQSNQIGNFLITTVGKTTSANVIPNMKPMGKLLYVHVQSLCSSANLSHHVSNGGARLKPQLQYKCGGTIGIKNVQIQ